MHACMSVLARHWPCKPCELHERIICLHCTRPCSVIRLSDWKLHEYFEDGALMPYNLRDDIGEQNDLAKERPQLVKKLHGMLQSWRKETGAIVPKAPNPRFDQKAEAKAIHAARLKLRPIK